MNLLSLVCSERFLTALVSSIMKQMGSEKTMTRNRIFTIYLLRLSFRRKQASRLNSGLKTLTGVTLHSFLAKIILSRRFDKVIRKEP
jgi:hypothetical protein